MDSGSRIEGLIALAAPALDLVLAIGDRISRIVEPEDHEYYPVRPGSDAVLPGEAQEGEDAAGEAPPGPEPGA